MVIRGAEPMTSVSPPNAVDAQGRRVESSMTVDGSGSSCSRRATAARPSRTRSSSIRSVSNFNTDATRAASPPYSWATTANATTVPSFDTWGSFGAGRYITMPPGINYIGSYGEWYYPAYGQSFLAEVTFYSNLLHLNSPGIRRRITGIASRRASGAAPPAAGSGSPTTARTRT